MSLNLQWTPCKQRLPDVGRRVLIYHRLRPWCRFFEFTVGWWNGKEWRRSYCDHPDFSRDHGIIYQPLLWKDVELPDQSNIRL
ncbi:MAG TPA: hypothetical protein VN281_05190 [Verrucomicrobiae bacterium]|nr:hypothetical protein [Verrucomicrobiae bacterium]